MKKWAILLLISATTLSAKDMGGHFGIGGNSTLGGTSGVSGLSARIGVSRMFFIEATLGLTFTDVGNSNRSPMHTSLATAALFNIVEASDVNLLIGPEVIWRYESDLDNSVGFALGVPLQVEYFFSDHFSIHSEVGIVLDIMQPGNNPGGPNPPAYESDFIFKIDNHLLGNAGFTFWF